MTNSIRDFDVVARDARGRTPLHIAVLHSSIECAKLILSFFPNAADVIDDFGETSQDLALNLGNHDILELFSNGLQKKNG